MISHDPDDYPDLSTARWAMGCFCLTLLGLILAGWWAFDRVADLLAHVIDQ